MSGKRIISPTLLDIIENPKYCDLIVSHLDLNSIGFMMLVFKTVNKPDLWELLRTIPSLVEEMSEYQTRRLCNIVQTFVDNVSTVYIRVHFMLRRFDGIQPEVIRMLGALYRNVVVDIFRDHPFYVKDLHFDPNNHEALSCYLSGWGCYKCLRNDKVFGREVFDAIVLLYGDKVVSGRDNLSWSRKCGTYVMDLNEDSDAEIEIYRYRYANTLYDE
jgi:hypothetical protein